MRSNSSSPALASIHVCLQIDWQRPGASRNGALDGRRWINLRHWSVPYTLWVTIWWQEWRVLNYIESNYTVDFWYCEYLLCQPLCHYISNPKFVVFISSSQWSIEMKICKHHINLLYYILTHGLHNMLDNYYGYLCLTILRRKKLYTLLTVH